MARLDIRIAEGRGFPKGGSKPDCYVVLSLGEEKQKTHTIAKSTNPRWQQVFKMKFDPTSTEKLWLEVWDKNFFSDTKLGWVSIPMQQIVTDCANATTTGCMVDRWVKLHECKTIGELHIRMNVEGISRATLPSLSGSSSSSSPVSLGGNRLSAPAGQSLGSSFGPGSSLGVPPPNQDQLAGSFGPGSPQHLQQANPTSYTAPPPQGYLGAPPTGYLAGAPQQQSLPALPHQGGPTGYPLQQQALGVAPQQQFNPTQLYDVGKHQQGNFGNANWFAIPENEIRVQPGPPLFDMGRSITYAAYHPMTNGAPSTLKRYRTTMAPSNEAFEALDRLRKASEHPSILYCFAPVRATDPQGSLIGMLLGHVTSPLVDWISKTDADTEAIIRALQSTAVGLAHMHSCGITHGNIKTSKFLVDVPRDPHEPPNFMLSAYGPSRLTGSVERTFYTAPEYELLQGPSCDVFSFGLAMWLLLHGPAHEFIKGVNPVEVTRRLQNGERPRIDTEKVGSAMSHLLESCWKPEPDRRPVMRSVVESLTSVVETFKSQAGLDPQMRVYVFAVERDPGSHMNWVNLARGLKDDQETVTACGERHNKKTALTRSVECDSHNASCWNALADTMDSHEKITMGGKPRGRRDCLVKAVLCDEQDSYPWAALARDLPTFTNDTVYIRTGLEDLTKIDCLKLALGCDPSSSKGRSLMAQLKQDHPAIVTGLIVAGKADLAADKPGASKTWVRLLEASSQEDLIAALGNDPECGYAWCALGVELSKGSEPGFPVNKRATVNGVSYRADTCFAQAVLALDDPKNDRTVEAATRWFALSKLMLDDNSASEVAGIKLFDACRRALELRHLNNQIPPPGPNKADINMFRHYQFVGKSFNREMGADSADHTIALPVYDAAAQRWKPHPEEFGRANILCHGLECRPLPVAGEAPRVEHAPLYRMLLRESDAKLATLSIRGVPLTRGRCLGMLTQVEPSQARNWYDLATWLDNSDDGSCTLDIDALGTGDTTTFTTIQALSNCLEVAEDGFETVAKARTRGTNRITAQYWFKAGEVVEELATKHQVGREVSDPALLISPRGVSLNRFDCYKECLRCDQTFGPAWGKLLDVFERAGGDQGGAEDFGVGLGSLFKLEVLTRFAVHEEVNVVAWKKLASALLFDNTVPETAVACDFAPKNGTHISASDCCAAILLVAEGDAEAITWQSASEILFYGSAQKSSSRRSIGKLALVSDVCGTVQSTDVSVTTAEKHVTLLTKMANAGKGPRPSAVKSQLFWLTLSVALRILDRHGKHKTVHVGPEKKMTASDCSIVAMHIAGMHSHQNKTENSFEIKMRTLLNHIEIHTFGYPNPSDTKYGVTDTVTEAIKLASEESKMARLGDGGMRNANPIHLRVVAKMEESTWLITLAAIKEKKVDVGSVLNLANTYAKITELNTSWETESYDPATPSVYFSACQALGKMFIARSTHSGVDKMAMETMEQNGRGATYWWAKLLALCVSKKDSAAGGQPTEGEAWLGLASVLVNDTHMNDAHHIPTFTIPSNIAVSEHKVDARYCLTAAAAGNPYGGSSSTSSRSELAKRHRQFQSEVYTVASKLMINTNLSSLVIDGRTWEVAKLIDEALSLWPENSQAHKRKGRLALQAQNVPQAKKSFERALAILEDPSNIANASSSGDSDLHALLGRLLVGEGKYTEANHHFVSSVETDPGSDFAWNNLGYALAGGEASASSLKVRVESRRQYLNSSSCYVYDRPVILSKCQGQTFTRQRVYAIALECTPHSAKAPYTWNCLGEALMAAAGPGVSQQVSGTTYTAQTAFEKALQLKPGSSRALLGLAKLEVADREKHIALLELCLTEEPTNVRALELAGTALRLNATLGRPKTHLTNGADACACYVKALMGSTSPGNLGHQVASWRGCGLVMQAGGQDLQLPCGPVSKKGCFVNALSINSRDAISWGGLGTTLGPEEKVNVGGRDYDARACFIFSIDFLDENNDEILDQAFAWNCMGVYMTGQQPLKLKSQPSPVDAQKCHQHALQLNPDGYTAGKLAMTFPRGSPGFHDNLVLACSYQQSGGGAFWIDLANALPPHTPYATVGNITVSKVEMLKKGVAYNPHNAFGWICLGCTLQPAEYCQQYNPRECFLRSVTCQNPDKQGWNYVASTMSEYDQLNVPGHGILSKADCLNRAR